jgi:hypothetical protein
VFRSYVIGRLMRPMILFRFFEIGTAMVLLLLPCCLLAGNTKLFVMDERTGEEITSFTLEDNGYFSISFVHSVNQSPIEEVYQVRKDSIYLVSCRFKSFGAGVATEISEELVFERLEDGWMQITGFNLKIDYLAYVVGTVSDHILRIDRKDYSLRELCGQNRFILMTPAAGIEDRG